jgi:hypothetical protein
MSMPHKSMSLSNWWSVSQSVLVSSPCWDSWPDFNSQVWLLQYKSSCSVLCDERAGLSFVICFDLHQVYIYFYFTLYKYTYSIFYNSLCTLYTWLLSVQTLHSRLWWKSWCKYRSRLDKTEAWLDQSERGEDLSEGRQSKEANGRWGDLSQGVGRKESKIHGSRQEVGKNKSV